MLARYGDDSDEEMYDNNTKTRESAAAVTEMQFPWYQQSYKPVFDCNEGLLDFQKIQGYPIANKTDQHVTLRPRHEEGLSDPPQRILIVCAQTHSVDLVLDKLAVLGDKIPIVRLGNSMLREDLNTKYTLEATRKNDAEAYERV